MDTDDDMCSCPAELPDIDAREDDDPMHRDGRRDADLPLMIFTFLEVGKPCLLIEHEAKEPN